MLHSLEGDSMTANFCPQGTLKIGSTKWKVALWPRILRPLPEYSWSMLMNKVLAYASSWHLIEALSCRAFWKYFAYFVDIDECLEDNHQCAFRCHNIIGSYKCTCPKGFTVASDGIHCEGQWLWSLWAVNQMMNQSDCFQTLTSVKLCWINVRTTVRI